MVADFDGGRITSDAGALLLGATDQVIGLTARFTACFRDTRRKPATEHSVKTLVLQRIIAITLGCEDLNNHDTLCHDPLMAVLAGKLTTRRSDCAPVAGRSTLNRLEHGLTNPRAMPKSAPTARRSRRYLSICFWKRIKAAAADHS